MKKTTTQNAKIREVKRDKRGRFLKGHSPKSLGRPKETKEQKLIKKEVKKWLEEYEQGLAEALPQISPALIAQANQGNIPAIAEIHKVLGAYKKEIGTIVPIQINFGEAREEFK
jgi:hypothetical protein